MKNVRPEKQRKSRLKDLLSHSKLFEEIFEPDFIAPSWKGCILELAFCFLLFPAIFVDRIGRLASIVFDKTIVKLFTLLKRVFRKN
jgi:hypothetical protein